MSHILKSPYYQQLGSLEFNKYLIKYYNSSTARFHNDDNSIKRYEKIIIMISPLSYTKQ